MIKYILFLASALGMSVANAANLVMAKISWNDSLKISKKVNEQIGKLESEGKVLISESNEGVELIYNQHEAPELFEKLKESGVVVRRITVSSQKTGGGCGDGIMRGSGNAKE